MTTPYWLFGTQMIFVLEGAFTVYTGNEVVTLTPGNHRFVPRNTPFCFHHNRHKL